MYMYMYVYIYIYIYVDMFMLLVGFLSQGPRPILIWRAGSADYKGMVREGLVDLMIQAFVVHLEETRVRNVCTWMNGFGVWDFSHRANETDVEKGRAGCRHEAPETAPAWASA